MAMRRSALEKLESDLSEVLMTSVKNGYEDVAAKAIHELAEHNAGPGCFDFSDDEKHFSPLMYTCERGLTDTAKLLLESGATPGFIGKKKRSSSKLNAFHLASMKGHAEIVQELLRASSELSGSRPAVAKTCRYGLTPAMHAVKNGHLKILQLLMEVDQNLLSRTTSKGRTVLHIAARGSKEHFECLKELCSRLDSTNREDVITRLDKNGWNVLHHACAGGHVDCLEWLLEEFKPELARPSVVNQAATSSGYTPFLVACEYQKVEIVEFLLQVEEVDCKACAVKSDREGGKTGLHIAAIHDSVKLAQILIREGCPPAALDEEGDTALHIAKKNSSFGVFDVLIVADSELQAVPNKEGTLAETIKSKFVIPREIKRRGKEREYVQALRKGKGKIPRCNLLILGEQRVGKTSLYNLLTGEKFIVGRNPTRGIDNTTVITTVDTRHLSIESWKEVDESKKNEMDEELFQNEIARHITPFDAREDVVTAPAENDLLEKIDRAVAAFEKTVSYPPPIVRVSSDSLENSLLKPKKVQLAPSVRMVPFQHKDSPTTAAGHPKARSSQNALPAALSTTPETTPTHPHHQCPPTAATQPRSIPKIKSEPSEREMGGMLIARRHSIGIQKKILSGSVVKSEPELHLNTFDFAGQKAYRPMHHCFITSRAMYIVVFNLRKFIDEVREASRESLEELRYWLHSIHAHIGNDADKESEVKQIVLVGTHRSPAGVEMTEAELQEIDKILRKEFHDEDHHNRCVNHLSFITCPSQQSRIFATVESSRDQPTQRESSGATVVQGTLKLLAKELPFLEEDYPLLYLRFEEELVQCRQKLHEEHSSQIVDLAKILELAERSGLGGEIDEEEGEGKEEEEGNLTTSRSVQTALDFFHDTGTIVVLSKLPKMFFDKIEEKELQRLVLLDPKWLLEVMRTVMKLDINAKGYRGQDTRDLDKKGVASATLLKTCWESILKDGSECSFLQLSLILQAYGLIFPINAPDNASSNPPLRSASVPAVMSQTTPTTHSQSGGVGLHPRERFLVPCRIPEKSDVKHLTGLTFFIDFQGFLPVEIFHRLICLMLNKSRSVPVVGKLMLNSTCCYFPHVENCQWRIEVLDRDCLKVTVRPYDYKKLLKADAEHTLMYLSMFYHDYLSRVCMKSGLRGIVYIAGPRCTAERDGKVCGKVLDLPMKLRDKDRPGHIICEYCPASYSQEELSNLMKDRDPKMGECEENQTSSASMTHPSASQPGIQINVSNPHHLILSTGHTSIGMVGQDCLPVSPMALPASNDSGIESTSLVPSFSRAGQDSLPVPPPNVALSIPADSSATQMAESAQNTESAEVAQVTRSTERTLQSQDLPVGQDLSASMARLGTTAPANHGQGQQQQQPQEVFREYFAYICRTVQGNVMNLAHEAYSQGLILKSTHSEVLNKSLPGERATVFIQALEDSIKAEPTRLEKFVEILKKSDPAYYSTLIDKLSSS